MTQQENVAESVPPNELPLLKDAANTLAEIIHLQNITRLLPSFVFLYLFLFFIGFLISKLNERPYEYFKRASDILFITLLFFFNFLTEVPVSVFESFLNRFSILGALFCVFMHFYIYRTSRYRSEALYVYFVRVLVCSFTTWYISIPTFIPFVIDENFRKQTFYSHVFYVIIVNVAYESLLFFIDKIREKSVNLNLKRMEQRLEAEKKKLQEQKS